MMIHVMPELLPAFGLTDWLAGVDGCPAAAIMIFREL